MSFEFKRPVVEGKETLDDKWYSRFQDCGSFEDYEYLGGEKEKRDAQKENFISGEIDNPALDYPNLEKLEIDRKEQELLALKSDILEKESNEAVKQVYRWKINQKIAELRMLRETKNSNDRRFLRYSKFIYGEPEKEIFDYTVRQVREVASGKAVDSSRSVSAAAQRLLDKLKEPQSGEETNLDKSREFMRENSEAGNFSKEELSAEDIKSAFERALEEYKLSGWEIVVDDNRMAVGVSQENKKISIPSERKMSEGKLAAIIKHEIGTHVLRRESGERSKLKLLGLGLDRYLKGEEGIAMHEEQKVMGAEEFAGLSDHLVVSLALGMDGKKRNFREVYEIMKDYYFVNSKKNEESEAMASAENLAWKICVRTFRGTSCNTPGACFTKDIVYREGNVGVWGVVKNNPEEVKRFSVGKYDPSNARHIWILEQLGITDADLDDLENSSNALESPNNTQE